MSYFKECNGCGKKIVMMNTLGRWHAFDDSIGSTIHKCGEFQKTKPTDQRISILEEHVKSILKRIDYLSDKLSMMEES